LIQNKVKRSLPEKPHEFRNDRTYLKTKKAIRFKLFEKVPTTLKCEVLLDVRKREIVNYILLFYEEKMAT
jgi:hypothetical protein